MNLTEIIAEISSFKRDCIEKGSLITPVNEDSLFGEDVKLSDHEVSHSDAGSHSLSVVPPPPPYQQEDTSDGSVQRIKFHDYFPGTTDAKNPSEEIHNTGWQASTPYETRDTARIKHQMNLNIKYVTKNGQDQPKEINMTAPIVLVTVSLPRHLLNKNTNNLLNDCVHTGNVSQRLFSCQNIPPGQSLNLSLYQHPVLNVSLLIPLIPI